MRSETILNALDGVDFLAPGSWHDIGRRNRQRRKFRAELSRRLCAWDFVQQKFPEAVLTERERGGKE
jgi:hypothetical protein